MTVGGNRTEDLINSGEILSLPCPKLLDHPLHFDFYQQSHLENLVASIRETGLLEPIVVSAHGGSYIILSGHYRIRAVRRLKWKRVLCRVLQCDTRLSAIIYCTANLLTRNLSALEEAYMISRLVSEENFTMAEIAKLWGHSKSWVSRRLALLTHLEPKMKKELEKGFLNPRVAQELARLPRGNAQERVLAIIKKEHLGKDAVTELVTWWLKAGETERETAEKKSFSRMPAQARGADYLAKDATGHLKACINPLTRLAALLKEEKAIDWWPMEQYRFLKAIFSELEQLLQEKTTIAGGN